MTDIVLFCSDLCGTYLKEKSELSREDNLRLFVNNLDYLCSKNNSEFVIFSFITDSNGDGTLINSINELLPYMNDKNIKLGLNFYNGGKILFQNNAFINIDDSNNLNQLKALKLFEYIDYLNSHGVNVVATYYADDMLFNHEVLCELNYNNYKIISLVPSLCANSSFSFSASESGIVGVNKCLKKYLNCNDKI